LPAIDQSRERQKVVGLEFFLWKEDSVKYARHEKDAKQDEKIADRLIDGFLQPWRCKPWEQERRDKVKEQDLLDQYNISAGRIKGIRKVSKVSITAIKMNDMTDMLFALNLSDDG
jgi:hypothetical protein